ncbi:MAG: hypothetical protein HUK02_04580 [Bacteroidaceae bacterium]|nr:hypothetical protein [Bacteroidaceae bacterium]
MEQFQKSIQQKMGWSDAIVTAIRTVKEANLYINAGLKEMLINGKPAL